MSHGTELNGIEHKLAADIKQNDKGGWQDVYKELQALYKADGGTDKKSTQTFEDDLKQINDYLHQQNLLPNVDIVDVNGQFHFENLPQKPVPTDTTGPNAPSAPATEGGPSTGFGGSGGYSGPSGSGGSLDSSGGGYGGGSLAPGDSLQTSGSLPYEGGGLDNVNNIAAQDLGQSLWADTQFAAATDNGVEGCAASVSEVYQQAGINYLDNASVMGLAQQATDHGWTDTRITNGSMLASAKPGDIIYGNNGGSDQHVGIVGVQNGQLVCFNNWSSDGKWHAEPLNSCYIVQHFGTNTHVLSPPPALAAAHPAPARPAPAPGHR